MRKLKQMGSFFLSLGGARDVESLCSWRIFMSSKRFTYRFLGNLINLQVESLNDPHYECVFNKENLERFPIYINRILWRGNRE
jgi:hypothetical protein